MVYTTSDGRRARATAKLSWSERIRDALTREDGFVLHLQPILNLATGEISMASCCCGCEASTAS